MIRSTRNAWSSIQIAAISMCTLQSFNAAASSACAQQTAYPPITSAQDRHQNAREPGIAWLDDLQTAQTQSYETGRPVLIHFYSNNCVPCKMLDQRAFIDPLVTESMARAVIPVKINVDRHREIADKYAVIRWPTDLYLLPNGEELYRTVSPQDPKAYAQVLERVSARNQAWIVSNSTGNSSQPEASQLAVVKSPAVPPNGTPRLTSAPTTAVPVSNSSQLYQNNQFPEPPNYSNSDENPYCLNENRGATNYDETVASNRIPMHFASHSNSQSAGNTYNQTQNAASSSYENYQQPAQPAKPSNVSLTGVASEDLSPAFDGCCPVTLQRKSEWTLGSNQFAVKHRGRIYHCINEEARTEFVRNPDQYSPVLSGYDIVHFMETGELVAGKRENGCWFQNRVFLFKSAENRAFFDQHALQYTRDMKPSGAPAKVATGTNVDNNRR